MNTVININSHEPTEELLTDSTSLVTGTKTTSTDSEKEAEPEPAPKLCMSAKRAVDGMKNQLEFMEQHQDFTAEEISFMHGLIKVSAKSSKRQVDFFFILWTIIINVNIFCFFSVYMICFISMLNIISL